MKRLAVLGHPVAHSRSPAMQSAALAQMGLADTWSYEAIDMAPEGFSPLVISLPTQGFVGVNVTVPHKVAALAVASSASDAALEIGAANTLSFSGGAIAADNTDAPGLIAALPSSPAGARALVMGAGGSGRAAVWALAREGARVSIWNRTPERATALAAELGAETAPDSLPTADYDLIVNCTTVGMGNADLKGLPVRADELHDRQTLVDLVYGSGETDLLRAAAERGATVVDGLEVLVRQGAASLRLWTGMEPPLETMRRAARSAEPDS